MSNDPISPGQLPAYPNQAHERAASEDGERAQYAMDWEQTTPEERELAYTMARRRYLTGITLRDAFAIAALQGDWASQDEATGCWENEDTPMHTAALEDRAALYYRMADAMLRARAKP